MIENQPNDHLMLWDDEAKRFVRSSEAGYDALWTTKIEDKAADSASIDNEAFIRELIEADLPNLEETAQEETPEELEELLGWGPSPREDILYQAASLTSGNRDVSYGHPRVNLTAAGELKLLMRKHMVRDISPGELEALDQVLTKIGRIITGPRPVRDNYVDGAAYLAIAGELAEEGGEE